MRYARPWKHDLYHRSSYNAISMKCLFTTGNAFEIILSKMQMRWGTCLLGSPYSLFHKSMHPSKVEVIVATASYVILVYDGTQVHYTQSIMHS